MKLLRLETERALPCIIGYLLTELCIGVMNLWSIFQLPVSAVFGWEYGSVVLVSSFYMVAFVTGSFTHGLLGPHLHPRFICYIGTFLYAGGFFLSSLLRGGSVWNIYLSYGVTVGLGSGLIHNTAMFGVMTWMPGRKGFAAGLAGAAFSVSAIILSTLIQNLLGIMSLPKVFQTLGVISFAVMIVSTTLVSTPSVQKRKEMAAPEGSWTGMKLGQAVRDIRFWVIALQMFLFSGCWNVIIPIIKPLGMLRGLSEPLAGLTVSLVGLVMIVSKLGMGPISDLIGRNKTLVISCMAYVLGAALLIFATGWVYMIGIWLPAFAYAAGGCIVPPLFSDCFGHKYSGGIYGCAFYSTALSSIIMNKISTTVNAAGVTTGNYTFTFVLCIIISIGSCFALFAFNRINRRSIAQAK